MFHNCAGVQQRSYFNGAGQRTDGILNTNGVDDSRHARSLYDRSNSSTGGNILFPVTIRTAAAYLVAKVRLYDTFNISFKVRDILHTVHVLFITLGRNRQILELPGALRK